MKNILILCTGNSCRSQLAHAYLDFFGKDDLNVFSAGVEVHGVNPMVIKILEEDNIHVNNYTSNHIDEYLHIDFDYIITVCDHAKETCPYIPSENAISIHKNFNDPSKLVSNKEIVYLAFKNLQNEIKEYCKEFVKKLS